MPKKWLVLALIFATVSSLSFSNQPLFNNVRSFTVKILTTPFPQKKDALTRENSRLRKKAGDLSLEISRMKDIEQENTRLRALLKFKKKFIFRTISAEVVAREPTGWAGSFIINRGTADNVKAQSAVCSAKGLLGKVIEAHRTRSFVVPLAHPSFKAGGVIKRSRINGVVVGAGGGQARMLYIPMNADVKEGEVVVTSEFSRIFPKGISIGEITSVCKSKTGLYQYAEIRPFASLFDEEEVLIIMGSDL